MIIVYHTSRRAANIHPRIVVKLRIVVLIPVEIQVLVAEIVDLGPVVILAGLRPARKDIVKRDELTSEYLTRPSRDARKHSLQRYPNKKSILVEEHANGGYPIRLIVLSLVEVFTSEIPK